MEMFYRSSMLLISVVAVHVYLTGCQQCPVHAGCTCEARNYTVITCSKLGVSIPRFAASNYYFSDMFIHGNNKIINMNELAFRDVRFSRLFLLYVSIPSYRCTDFAGLETSLTYLHIAVSPLDAVPACAISRLKNLYTLELHTTRISTIKENDFAGLTFLTHLNLGLNSIQNIESGAFNELAYLRTLNLGQNRIAEVKKSWLQPQTKLVSLYLESNYVSDIPIGVFDNLTRLEVLSLRSNYIENIPEGAFKENWKLKQLIIQDNHITHLPEQLFVNLNELTEFDACNNRISHLPSNLFQQTSKIQKLSLSSNNLQGFVWDSLYRLVDLRQLLLDNSVRNGSVVVSVRFYEYWPNLDTIHLKNSRVTAILPDSITKLQNLETVDLSNNELKFIPEKIFENCVRLRYLRLQNNNLATIHPKVIENLGPALEVLDLLNNPLECSTITAIAKKMPMLTGLKQVLIPTVDACPFVVDLVNATSNTFDNDSVVMNGKLRYQMDKNRFILMWSIEPQYGVLGFRLVYTDLLNTNRTTERLIHPDVRSDVLYDILPGQSYNVCISVQTSGSVEGNPLCTILNGSHHLTQITSDSRSSSNKLQSETIYIILGSVLGAFVFVVVGLILIILKLKCFKISHVNQHDNSLSSEYVHPSSMSTQVNVSATDEMYSSID